MTAATLAIAAGTGVLSAGFTLFTRILSREGGVHRPHLPPTLLLSHQQVVYTVFFALMAAGGAALGLSARDGWEWLCFIAPHDATDWLLIGGHCVGVLTAQLALAAGYATTRAGIGAFLQLTELAWVWAMDVFLLGEPTSALASAGSAIVFGSAFLVLRLASTHAQVSADGGARDGAPGQKHGPQGAITLQ